MQGIVLGLVQTLRLEEVSVCWVMQKSCLKGHEAPFMPVRFKIVVDVDRCMKQVYTRAKLVAKQRASMNMMYGLEMLSIRNILDRPTQA